MRITYSAFVFTSLDHAVTESGHSAKIRAVLHTFTHLSKDSGQGCGHVIITFQIHPVRTAVYFRSIDTIHYDTTVIACDTAHAVYSVHRTAAFTSGHLALLTI